MIQLTAAERQQLQQRFPKLKITTTKRHCFLAAYDSSAEMQFLLSLRGQQPEPQPRRESSRQSDRFGNRSADPRFRQNRS